MKDSQRKALRNYKAKVARITVDFPPSDSDLYDHLQAQGKKQTYIKRLIREDMEKQAKK